MILNKNISICTEPANDKYSITRQYILYPELKSERNETFIKLRVDLSIEIYFLILILLGIYPIN